jgi:hypothetical protein
MAVQENKELVGGPALLEDRGLPLDSPRLRQCENGAEIAFAQALEEWEVPDERGIGTRHAWLTLSARALVQLWRAKVIFA